MSFISSFDIVSAVDEGWWGKAEDEEWRRPDIKIFLCIPASGADAAAVNPKGIKTILANGLITFFISGNPVFSNGPRSLPRNPPDYIILDIWAFDNVISVDKQFSKTIRRFATCLLINNNLRRKFVSSSPTIFDDNLKTISVSFFIADFNLSSCEFNSLTLKLLYCVILYRSKLNHSMKLNSIVLTKLLQFLVKSLTQFLLLLQ